MDYHLHQLSNGIRILLKPVDSIVSHACIIMNTGARNELPHQFGMAHFIEHLLFKKTERRGTNQILNRLESVGADLNAYTTKEYTCIHASFLQSHLLRVLDLFEDVVFHSIFPESELEKEKDVILDEIASYQDSPEDAIMDDFEDLVFRHHPLGHNILGTVGTVKNIRRADMLTFFQQHYCTDQMVVAITGNYRWSQVIKQAEKLFGKISPKRSAPERHRSFAYQSQHVHAAKPIVQAHISMGGTAYHLYHKQKIGMMVLNNLLGGMGMSSRLNLEIRERYGIAYTIDSNYTPYADSGIFSIYFGTDRDKVEKALRLVYKELSKLRSNKLGVLQLHQAKQKFIGQIALAEENRMGVLISMAKNLLDYDCIIALEEIVHKIEAVTAVDLWDIANETLDESRFSSLSFLPIEI